MKKTIRVLLLSNMGPSKNKPNSGRFVMNQYEALRKNSNLKVEFFYLNQEKKSPLVQKIRYPLFFVRFLFNCIFSSKKKDVIHVHFYFPNILLAIVYKFLRNWRVKIVVTFHGSDIYSYVSPNIIYRACTRFIDSYIFVSEKLKERFFKPVAGHVLSAGVNDIYYQQKQKSNFKNKQFDVVFVGHLDKNKGIERLEEILIKFPCKIRVVIVGTGNSTFISRVEKSNSNVNITYFENCTPEQLVTIYYTSYMLINLSYNESFGLVMSEAMACGVIVLATQTDGACAQIVNGNNGVLVLNQDDSVCSSAINAMQDILRMPEEQYVSISNNAIKSVQQYRLSLITEQVFNIYAKLRANNVNDK
ncbi:glycosyltransferase family 4 protein [Pseudoalteromonas sp. SA25]|uniref:glycosyltransferase family 4 protein n=1 Tax=Pseudoalteromonas sp. SA25 TaxID=2686347 RepID=UPI0013FDD80F|nr:glycosyltransferase family 4 protein [Pseudoalteromonas sp. SA25]